MQWHAFRPQINWEQLMFSSYQHVCTVSSFLAQASEFYLCRNLKSKSCHLVGPTSICHAREESKGNRKSNSAVKINFMQLLKAWFSFVEVWMTVYLKSNASNYSVNMSLCTQYESAVFQFLKFAQWKFQKQTGYSNQLHWIDQVTVTFFP